MPAGMTATQELVEQVRAATDGGPYVVEERPYGFELTLDVVDARWYSLMRVNSLQRVFTHQVHVDAADRTIAITDVANTVEWDAGGTTDGPPTLHVEADPRRGRVHEFAFHKEFGVDADSGNTGAVADYTFSAVEGRDLIRAAASHAGFSERIGRDQRIGLAVAGVILAALLVAGLVAFVISRAG